ncbi:MAG: beta strand repeat-containing protein [Sulfobacillus sp.]
MKRLGVLIGLFLNAISLFAQTGAIQGYSYMGGTPARTQGLQSSNYLNGVIPSATISVYLTGTQTLATIYKDGNNTPLGNPFTSNAVNSTNPGGYIFYAATGQPLDVVASRGIFPNVYSSPIALYKDIYPGFGGGGSGCPAGNCVLTNPTASQTVTQPAGTSFNLLGGPLYVGNVPTYTANIGALGTMAASWNFDTTTPATALGSLNGLPLGGGTLTGGLTVPTLTATDSVTTPQLTATTFRSTVDATTFSGSDDCAKVNAAVASLLGANGIIDATGFGAGNATVSTTCNSSTTSAGTQKIRLIFNPATIFVPGSTTTTVLTVYPDTIVEGFHGNSTSVSGYSVPLVSFPYAYSINNGERTILRDFDLNGTTAQGTGIQIEPSTDGVSFVTIEDGQILGFNVGLALLTPNASTYINGNNFVNLSFNYTTTCLDLNNGSGNNLSQNNFVNVQCEGGSNIAYPTGISLTNAPANHFINVSLWDYSVAGQVAVTGDSTSISSAIFSGGVGNPQSFVQTYSSANPGYQQNIWQAPTGYLVINGTSNGNLNDSPFIVNNNQAAGATMPAFVSNTPNAAAGDLIENDVCSLDTGAANQCVDYGMYYAGLGSTSNYASIGFNGNEGILKVYGTGEAIAPFFTATIGGSSFIGGSNVLRIAPTSDAQPGYTLFGTNAANSAVTWGFSALGALTVPTLTATTLQTTQLATPAAPAGTISTTGGTLAAATYTVEIAAVDALGNTTPVGASTAFTTTGTTSSIALTWTAVANASSYQVWLTTGQYFTSSTPSFTLTTATGTAGTAPTVNNTGGATIAGPLTASNSVTTPIVIGSDAATFAAGPGAGTSPTAPACMSGYTCIASSGTVTITTGTSPTNTGALIDATFNPLHKSYLNCTVSGFGVAAGASILPYIGGTDATTFSIYTANVPAASTLYEFSYVCQQ